MKMKKYTIFSIILLLCISIGIGFGVCKQKDDLDLYFVEESEQGDASLIQNLKYSIKIDGAMDHGWTVHGVGKQMDVESTTINYLNYEYFQKVYGTSIEAYPCLFKKDIINKQDNSNSNNDGFDGNARAINYQFRMLQFDEEEKMLYVPMNIEEKYKLKTVDEGILIEGYYNKESSAYPVNNIFAVNSIINDKNDILEYRSEEIPLSYIFDGTKTYGYISERLLGIDLQQFTGKKNYGGIYSIDKKGNIEHLIKMEIGQKDIQSLLLYQDKIACIIKEKKQFTVSLFNKDGTPISTMPLENTKKVIGMKRSGNRLLVFIEKEQAEYDTASRMLVIEGLEKLTLVKEFSGVEQTDYASNMMYKNGYLYRLRNNNLSALLEVYDESKKYYSGEITSPLLEERKRNNFHTSSYEMNPTPFLGDNMQAYITSVNFEE